MTLRHRRPQARDRRSSQGRTRDSRPTAGLRSVGALAASPSALPDRPGFRREKPRAGHEAERVESRRSGERFRCVLGVLRSDARSGLARAWHAVSSAERADRREGHRAVAIDDDPILKVDVVGLGVVGVEREEIRKRAGSPRPTRAPEDGREVRIALALEVLFSLQRSSPRYLGSFLFKLREGVTDRNASRLRRASPHPAPGPVRLDNLDDRVGYVNPSVMLLGRIR